MNVKYTVKVVDEFGRKCTNHRMVFTAVSVGIVNGSSTSQPLSNYTKTREGTTDSNGLASVYFPTDDNGNYPIDYNIVDSTVGGAQSSYKLTIFLSIEDGVSTAPTVNYTSTASASVYRYQIYVQKGISYRAQAVSGATVSYRTTSALTDSSGYATFTANTSPITVTASRKFSDGTYTGSTSATGATGSAALQTATISIFKQDSIVLPSTYRYNVYVKKQNGSAISGACVAFFGMNVETETAVTDSSGLAYVIYKRTASSPTDLPTQYTVTKSGYVTVSGNLATATAVSGALLSYASNNTAVTDESVTVQGICYDASTASPLSGVAFTMYYGTSSTSTATTVATSNSSGYYSAELMKDPTYWKYAFTKDGYVAEDNTLFGDSLPRFLENVRWDQILWKGSLPENVNNSCAYKEWMIANRGEDFTTLPENLFQMVPKESLDSKVLFVTEPNSKQIVPKTYIDKNHSYRFTLADWAKNYSGTTFIRSNDKFGQTGGTFSLMYDNSNIKQCMKNDTPYGWNFYTKETYDECNIYLVAKNFTSNSANRIIKILQGTLWKRGIKLSPTKADSLVKSLVKNDGSKVTVYSTHEKMANDIFRELANSEFADIQRPTIDQFPHSVFSVSPIIKWADSTLLVSQAKSKWGTNSVYGLFSGFTMLKEIYWYNTPRGIDTYDSFAEGAESLENVTLTDPNACPLSSSEEITFTNAFYDCTSLQHVVLENIFNHDMMPDNFDNMFYNCRSLKSVSFKGLDLQDAPGSVPINMFGRCYNLERVTFTDCTDVSKSMIYSAITMDDESTFTNVQLYGNSITMLTVVGTHAFSVNFIYGGDDYTFTGSTPFNCTFSIYYKADEVFHRLYHGVNTYRYPVNRIRNGENIYIEVDPLPDGYIMGTYYNGQKSMMKELATPIQIIKDTVVRIVIIKDTSA